MSCVPSGLNMKRLRLSGHVEDPLDGELRGQCFVVCWLNKPSFYCISAPFVWLLQGKVHRNGLKTPLHFHMKSNAQIQSGQAALIFAGQRYTRQKTKETGL